jgi:hypothetical protein
LVFLPVALLVLLADAGALSAERPFFDCLAAEASIEKVGLTIMNEIIN